MDKKFYWIKLKTNFFNREDIDFILSQENGCEYIVLYQMLCLNTANTDGRLESQMNEVIVPYDIKKIVRDCKYFEYDTVAVALELFKKLGLIYEEEDKTLKISNYDDMVGSETKWAEKKRIYRNNKKMLGHEDGQNEDNVRQENRDKSIEIRDKNKEKENRLFIGTTSTTNNIYEYVEQNFGRTLSGIEIEKINEWLLSFEEEIIKYAIQISTLNNKRTFNYTNGILKNWKSNGYKTLQEIKDSEIKERTVRELTPEEKEIFEYNWLEDDDYE